ncbi:hypothetical protein Trydic_g17962 [Trypoxylus dichotomus]
MESGRKMILVRDKAFRALPECISRARPAYPCGTCRRKTVRNYSKARRAKVEIDTRATEDEVPVSNYPDRAANPLAPLKFSGRASRGAVRKVGDGMGRLGKRETSSLRDLFPAETSNMH